MLNRVTITLSKEEGQALATLAQVNLRPPKDQLRFLLREAARQRGLFPAEPPQRSDAPTAGQTAGQEGGQQDG